MANSILLYPTLTTDLFRRIRYQKTKYTFFYLDENEDEHELKDEAVDEWSTVYFIKDDNGIWTQDDYNFCLRRKYCLRTFQCLFGEDGLVCKNAKLGLAVIWTSSDSKQRGVVKVGSFGSEDHIMEGVAEHCFKKAQLRGDINFSTVLYIEKKGTPEYYEKHLANQCGYILGELENCTVKLDGTGSVFPVFEVAEPDQPLWYVSCDWIDPAAELFSECVSINLNTAHKNYRYIDRTQKTFNRQLLSEIMASAISVIIEQVRCQTGYWEQIMNNDGLEHGSVGQAIFYFSDTLGWDLSSPRSTAVSARKFFDKRIK